MITEGRDIGPLSGVHINRQDIFPIKVEVGSEVKGKRSVAALVLAQVHTVDPDCGRGHYAFKINEDVLALRLDRQTETPAVEGNELIRFVVEAVPGQANIGVRNHHAFKCGVVELPPVPTFDK